MFAFPPLVILDVLVPIAARSPWGTEHHCRQCGCLGCHAYELWFGVLRLYALTLPPGIGILLGLGVVCIKPGYGSRRTPLLVVLLGDLMALEWVLVSV